MSVFELALFVKAQVKSGNQFNNKKGQSMKKIILCLTALLIISGCENPQTKEKQRVEALSKLTCQSSRENRTQEELQAIGDACFRGGSFRKSSGIKW